MSEVKGLCYCDVVCAKFGFCLLKGKEEGKDDSTGGVAQLQEDCFFGPLQILK